MRTLAEQGLPGVDSNNWYALFAPARTPKAVVDQLNKALNQVLGDKDVMILRNHGLLTCGPTLALVDVDDETFTVLEEDLTEVEVPDVDGIRTCVDQRVDPVLGDRDGPLAFLFGHLEVGNVTLFLQDARDFHLQLGYRNVHALVLGGRDANTNRAYVHYEIFSGGTGARTGTF